MSSTASPLSLICSKCMNEAGPFENEAKLVAALKSGVCDNPKCKVKLGVWGLRPKYQRTVIATPTAKKKKKPTQVTAPISKTKPKRGCAVFSYAGYFAMIGPMADREITKSGKYTKHERAQLAVRKAVRYGAKLFAVRAEVAAARAAAAAAPIATAVEPVAAPNATA